MRLRHGLLLLSSFSLLSCASLSTNLPEITEPNLNDERRSQVNMALENRHEYLQRLASIAQPILTENVELCPRVRPYYGLSTHSIESYSKHIRADAEQVFDLSEEPRVLIITPGSPAAAAGIQREISFSAKRIPLYLQVSYANKRHKRTGIKRLNLYAAMTFLTSPSRQSRPVIIISNFAAVTPSTLTRQDARLSSLQA